MKVSVIVGTRPEAIKLGPIILGLQSDPRFDCHVCATAQHRQMLDQVLQIFNITPDVDLDLMQPNQTLPELTSRALLAIGEYLTKERPDMVLVQGDTTTVLAASLAAYYQNIPVGHVEAGLRTGDLRSPYPEEANRVLTSQLTTLHFAPTEASRKNLLREGIPNERIFVTGNTVIDALYHVLKDISACPPEIPGIDPALMNSAIDTPLVLITGHRRENFGNRLRSMCLAIAQLAVRFPEAQFVYPVHLNPKVRSTVWETLGVHSNNTDGLPNVHLIDPLSYVPFVALMKRATVILTDSGGIQEEAPALGKPLLVLREETERPEALAGGTVKLVGTDQHKIVDETTRLLTDSAYLASMSKVCTPYGDGKATPRILNAVGQHLGLGTDYSLQQLEGCAAPCD
jgi:UDP-N-acetylglucosamine 2-epimerase (non-hydrolysing)